MSRSNKDEKEKKAGGLFGGLLGGAEKALKTRRKSVDSAIEKMVSGEKKPQNERKKPKKK